MANIHNLKTDAEPYQDAIDRRKKFELRKDDRDFKVGDELVLFETRYTGAQMTENPGRYPLQYTGRFESFKVTHILRAPAYGIPEGFVIMSME